MSMSFFATGQTISLLLNRLAKLLIGSLEKVMLFIGEQVNGMPKILQKLIKFVKNMVLLSPLLSNQNTTFSQGKKFNLSLDTFSLTISLELLFGLLWQVVFWLGSITTEFLKEADSIKIQNSKDSFKFILMIKQESILSKPWLVSQKLQKNFNVLKLSLQWLG